MGVRGPVIVLVASLAVPACCAQSKVRETQQNSNEWPSYNHDLAGTRYSPLKQMDTTNVAKLAEAWSYPPGASFRSYTCRRRWGSVSARG